MLLEKIKNSYYKFIKADEVSKYMNSKMSLIISDKIIDRYNQVINAVKYNKYDNILLTREIGNQLDFL